MRELSSPADQKGFFFALRFVTLFAAAHVILVFLQTNFVPMAGGWNTVWLGLELLLGLGCLCLALGFFFYALRHRTPSLESFRELLRDIWSPGFVFLALWVVWAYIACLLAIREGWTSFYHNVRYLFYQSADMLVLFPLGMYYGRRQLTRLLALLFDACLALLTVLLLYGFLRFLGGEIRFDVFFGHSFDFTTLRPILGMNPNQLGSYASFFLLTGVWRFGTLRTRIGKVLLIAAEIVLMVGFAMVESRGAVIGMACSIGVGAFFLLWRQSKKGAAIRFSLSIGGCVLAMAVFLLVFYGARTVTLSVQNRVLERVYTAQADSLPAEETPPGRGSTLYIAPSTGVGGDQEKRDLVGSGASTMGGRKKIWLTVIRGALKDPHLLLHGVSMANTSDWVAPRFGRPMRTHNQLLEVLVAQGVPALALFVFWLFWLAGKSLRLLAAPVTGVHWLLPLPLMLLVAHNMLEMMLVGRPHVVSGFFYLIAGYVAGFAPKKNV